VLACIPRLLVGHVPKVKKYLASLPMQLGLRVSMAHTHVPKAPDARAIMGLQNMCAGGIINDCKTCGQVATVHHRPC
jgi:hypothetical protein